MIRACESGHRRASPACRMAGVLPGAFRQPARFLQFLNQAGFSVRRDKPCVQIGIRTPRRTIRSEHSARTDAQTIPVRR